MQSRARRCVGGRGSIKWPAIRRRLGASGPAVHRRCLPFQNMSGDPEQEYFADGMVEEIITALVAFPLPCSSSPATPASPTKAGRWTSSRSAASWAYAMSSEGSVRRSAERVRHSRSSSMRSLAPISGQTVSTVRSRTSLICRDRVARARRERDRTALGSGRARAWPGASRPPNLGACDYYAARALANSYPTTKEQSEEVLRLAYKAIELDPGFASACGYRRLAARPARDQNQWTDDAVRERADAAEQYVN